MLRRPATYRKYPPRIITPWWVVKEIEEAGLRGVSGEDESQIKTERIEPAYDDTDIDRERFVDFKHTEDLSPQEPDFYKIQEQYKHEDVDFEKTDGDYERFTDNFQYSKVEQSDIPLHNEFLQFSRHYDNFKFDEHHYSRLIRSDDYNIDTVSPIGDTNYKPQEVSLNQSFSLDKSSNVEIRTVTRASEDMEITYDLV
ncbi:MAG: hypothetical protein QW303_00475 [Nitrososphaerota archaeon]